MRCLVLGLLAATLVAAVPARAFAYCRTTTMRVPPGYNPAASGCITGGTDLVWPSMPVTYQLEQESSDQVSLGSATAVFDRAFAKWSAAQCGGSGATSNTTAPHPALSFVNLGPTDAGYTPCEAGPCGYTAQDAPHVIIFRDHAWPYSDATNTVALTTVTFGVDDGHIFASEMEINSFEHTISSALPAPVNAYSLEAIATHEAGHFVGLAHSQLTTAVMFAFYQPNATDLTSDDEAAICAAYPPAKAASSGCSCDGVGERLVSPRFATILVAVLALATMSRRVLLGRGRARVKG
jgi:Matrixin